MFQKNLDKFGRILRLIASLVLFAFGILYDSKWLLLFGLFALIEAFSSWCLLFAIFGINTCKVKK